MGDGYIRTTISWPDQKLVDAMDAMAKKERRTRSNFVLNAVAEYLRTSGALPGDTAELAPRVSSASAEETGVSTGKLEKVKKHLEAKMLKRAGIHPDKLRTAKAAQPAG